MAEKDITALIEEARRKALEEQAKQFQAMQQRYQAKLREYVGEDTLSEVHKELEQEQAWDEIREKARLYDELQAKLEVERVKQEYIAKTCQQLGIDPNHPKLKRDAETPDEFLESALAVFKEGAHPRAGMSVPPGVNLAEDDPRWFGRMTQEEMVIADEILRRERRLPPAELQRRVKEEVRRRREAGLPHRTSPWMR